MQIIRSISTALFLALCAAAQAHATASDWHHVEGGAIRIVTAGAPDADGLLRGALEIRLAPGWKTYWLDPGESGVPPTLDIVAGAQDATVEMGFPAPRRFDDGYSLWTGYDEPVSLALTLKLPDAKTPARLEANVFLGVCETICIPVQAQLTFDTQASATDPEHASVVAAAFAALPGPARRDFGAHATDVSDDAMLVEATLPQGARALDLFVAGTETLSLGMAERQAGDEGAAVFRVPVLGRAQQSPGESVLYTLVTTAGAVTGELVLP